MAGQYSKDCRGGGCYRIPGKPLSAHTGVYGSQY
jgi:hypothetical protein